MPDKYHRKTPARSEKRQQKKAPAVVELQSDFPPTADWLPQQDAGFIAWGQVAHRARTEARTGFQAYQRNKSDTKLCQAYEDALRIHYYALERSYPSNFWEGMDDLIAGTADNLEPYITFLEADLYFFGSGYAKIKVIQGLKRIALSQAQKRRLQTVVLRVVDKGYRTEFRHYCRLARAVQTPDWLKEVEARLASDDPDLAVRARWVLEACRHK